MKSYVISHVSSRLPGPVQKRSRSCSIAPRFESNETAPRPLRLSESVLFGFEIRLQWFISPYKASQTLGPHPPFPASETFPSLSSCRSMTVRLRRGGIPLHKLTRLVARVSEVPPMFGVTTIRPERKATKFLEIFGIALSACRTAPSQRHRTRGVHGTGQVCHVVTVAVKLRHTPPHT